MEAALRQSPFSPKNRDGKQWPVLINVSMIAEAGGARINQSFCRIGYTQMLHQQYASLSLDRIKIGN